MAKKTTGKRKLLDFTLAMDISVREDGSYYFVGQVTAKNLTRELKEFLITVMRSMPDGEDTFRQWAYSSGQRSPSMSTTQSQFEDMLTEYLIGEEGNSTN